LKILQNKNTDKFRALKQKGEEYWNSVPAIAERK
jgi:hypothetical protein